MGDDGNRFCNLNLGYHGVNQFASPKYHAYDCTPQYPSYQPRFQQCPRHLGADDAFPFNPDFNGSNLCGGFITNAYTRQTGSFRHHPLDIIEGTGVSANAFPTSPPYSSYPTSSATLIAAQSPLLNIFCPPSTYISLAGCPEPQSSGSTSNLPIKHPADPTESISVGMRNDE